MPKYKKYNFVKILKEYNKEYKKNSSLVPEISKAIIVHSLEPSSFDVTYRDGYSDSRDDSLENFLYYKALSPPDVGKLIAFILHKEEGSLSLKIVILPSNKIRYAYLQSNYFASGVGNLGKSCMRSKEHQRSLNFYIKNNVKIVVVTDDNHKIHARALLWDNVKSIQLKTSFTYLDRVYTKSEHLVSLFNDLAKENNWKAYQTTSPGNAKSGYYIDNIDVTNMCHFPYTDTFRFLYYKDNLVASSTPNSIIHMIKHTDCLIHLTNQSNGGYYPELDPNRVREAISGNYISKKDAVKVKRYNGYVLKRNIANIDGAYYSIFDDLIVKAANDKYILKENSVTEIFTNNVIDKSKAIQSPKYKEYIYKSNVVYIKDEIYHKLDNNIICFHDKWYHISQCFINYNREEANKEIAKQPVFFHQDLSKNWVPYVTVTREGDIIPKEHAIIAYDLICNPALDEIQYQERYFTERSGLIKLTTGEFIVDTPNNRKYLKKFNNKYYIKQDFKLPNKKQLAFDFGGIK